MFNKSLCRECLGHQTMNEFSMRQFHPQTNKTVEAKLEPYSLYLDFYSYTDLVDEIFNSLSWNYSKQ